MPVVSTGEITIIDVNDGIAIVLSKYSHILVADEAGTVPAGNFTDCKTTVTIINGGKDDTNNWNLSAVSSVGLTGSLASNVYSVTALSAAVGGVTFTASRVGFPNLVADFSVEKLKNPNGGIAVILSNENHTFATDNSGTVGSYTGSGTTVQVYEGAFQFNAVSSISTASQFTIGTPVITTGTITVGSRSYSGVTATVAAHSGMNTDQVVITYPISIRRRGATSNITINKVQTLTKSKKGDVGTPGDTGQRGPGFFGGTYTSISTTTSTITSRFTALTGFIPVVGDIFVQTLTTGLSSSGKKFDGTSWVDPALMINGDLIVSGSIGATHIAASAINSTHISAGAITTDKLDANAVTAEKLNVSSVFAQTITLPVDGVLKAGTVEDYAELGGSSYFKAQSGNSTIFKIAKDGSHFIDGRFITNTLPPEAFDANVIPYIRSQLSLGTPSAGGSSSITGTLGAYGVMLTTTDTIASSGVGEPASIVVGYGGIEVSVQSMTLPSAAPKITLQVQRITNGGSPANVGTLKEFIGEFRRTESGSPATYEFSVPSFRVLETDSAPGAGNLQYKVVISLISPINLGDDLGIVTLAASQRAAGTVSGTITWDSLVGTPSNKITLASSGAQLKFPNLGTTDPAGTSNGDVWFRSNQLYFNSNGSLRTLIHNGNPTALAGDISQAEAEAGTATSRRWFTSLRVAQAIAAQAPSKTGSGASGTWGIDITGVASGAGYLTSARTFTIGNTGKLFNGSGNVSWSHAEMGTIRNFGSVAVQAAAGDANITTAQFISWLSGIGALQQPSVMKCSWSYAGNNNISDTGFGTLELAGCVIETFPDGGTYIIRVTSPSTGTGAGGIHEYQDQGAGYSPGWRRVYTSTLNGNISGNASSATNLQTARIFTIGNTAKSFNGGGDVSWSLSEIGALPAGYTGTLNVNAANGTALYTGSTSTWTNRGPSVSNAGALLSINTHAGNYYSQLWFNTSGNALYHRTSDNALPTAAWDRIFTDAYHPNADSITGFNNPTTAATANTIAYRDGSADIHARLFRSNYADQASISGAMAFRVNNSSDNFIRFCSNTAAIRTWMGADNASNLTLGTLDDARLPGTMSQKAISKTVNAAGANDYHLELYSLNSGSSGGDIALRFHQGGQWYHSIRANSAGFRLTSGVSNGLVGIVAGTYSLGDSGGYLGAGAGSSMRVQTPTGYVDVGSTNAGWAHFSTDRPGYYFNRSIHVDGELQIYNTGTGLNSSGMFWGSGATNLTATTNGIFSLTSPNLENFVTLRTSSGIAGYLYGYSTTEMGFLDRNATWSFRVFKDQDRADFYVNNLYVNNANYHAGGITYANGIRLEAADSNMFKITTSANYVYLALVTNDSTPRGYVFADNSNNIGFLDQVGNWKLRVDPAGMLHVADGTSTSDRRVKRNIQPIQNALAKVNKLTGNTYDQIEMGIRRAGPIAQEVEIVLPEAVSADDKGKLAVSQMGLIALLIEAVKELSTEVDTLKRRLH